MIRPLLLGAALVLLPTLASAQHPDLTAILECRAPWTPGVGPLRETDRDVINEDNIIVYVAMPPGQRAWGLTVEKVSFHEFRGRMVHPNVSVEGDLDDVVAAVAEAVDGDVADDRQTILPRGPGPGEAISYTVLYGEGPSDGKVSVSCESPEP